MGLTYGEQLRLPPLTGGRMPLKQGLFLPALKAPPATKEGIMGVTLGPVGEGDLKNPTPLVPASQSEAPSSLPAAHGTPAVVACRSQHHRLLS